VIGGQAVHPFGAAIEARDVDAAVALLADDVEFRSPVAATSCIATTAARSTSSSS
jgi:hypothetical protein